MDQDQEQRHVCRFCNKSFLSGKVLGGHMRCHGTKNSAKTEKKKLINQSEKVGEGTGYGLRVNPKKSSRVSGGSNGLELDEPSSGQDVFCRVCGKGFDSMRALFGHMRHHSGKRKKEEVHCKECGREFESLRALTGHMKSHSEKRFLGVSNGVPRVKIFGETSRLVRKKRSRRLLRYKISPNRSFSNLSESSGGVELAYDKEVEEVAICLLMLSRGVRSWDEFCSVAESSDNNSSPFEAKSPNRALDNGDGWIKVVKKPRLEKLETIRASGSGTFCDGKVSELSENDFGLESDEEKILSLEASVDAEIEKESQEDGMRILSPVELEFDENQREDLVSGLMLNSEPETFENSHSKKGEYKCRTCNKIFNSHQALGGHQTIHRSAKSNFPGLQSDDSAAQCSSDFPGIEAAKCEENSMELVEMESKVTMSMSTSFETNSNNKEHKCPICFRVFGSGQALGGHKRAHMARDSEVGADQITLVKQKVCNISDVLDFGVSRTLGDEEANTDVQLKSWWAKNDHKHEVLVGLMPN